MNLQGYKGMAMDVMWLYWSGYSCRAPFTAE
jgi:hypothetical protein